MYRLLLALICFIAYANAWPDVLVFDDKELLANGRLSLLGFNDIGRFFSEGMWVASGAEAGIYRPLFLVWMTLESKLFGTWYAGHHLVNITFHALVTVLLYGLCRQLLKRVEVGNEAAQWAAFLAAAVFAVHPVHAEVVNSIFNGSELFVSIAVLGGLHWFLMAREKNPWMAWLGLNVIYLLALLFRESAASLPGLAVALLFLVSREPWMQRIKQCLPVVSMFVPLAIYLYLRSRGLAGEFIPAGASDTALSTATAAAPIADGPTLGINTAAISQAIFFWFESLKLLIWPHPLQIYYDSQRDHLWLAAGIQAILLGFATWRYLWQKKIDLLCGLAFFYLAILPSSRIIVETTGRADLADRLLYLPSAGLSIALALGLAGILVERRGRVIAGGALAAVCLLMTGLTLARNADWSNEIRLFETDYARLERPANILYTLIGAHLAVDDLGRATQLCRKHANVSRIRAPVALRCASAFARAGKFDDAEALLKASGSSRGRGKTVASAHFNLASMYAQQNRRTEAQAQFEQAIALENLEFVRLYMEAGRLLALYPHDPKRVNEARSYLEASLKLQPRFMPARTTLEQLP